LPKILGQKKFGPKFFGWSNYQNFGLRQNPKFRPKFWAKFWAKFWLVKVAKFGFVNLFQKIFLRQIFRTLSIRFNTRFFIDSRSLPDSIKSDY
jgi:hypothetical protein